MREAGGRTVLSIDGTLPAGSSGPPLHVHYEEREEGAVRAGTLGAVAGGTQMLVRAGGEAAFPAGTAHRWWNAGEGTLEFSGRAVPVVDLDRFLQAMFAVINAGEADRPPLFYLAHVVWRHRRTQGLLGPPRALQRVIFPAVILLGRLLGKYRGEAWPGSPATCPGAPTAEQ
jgi:hypothetical protein